MALTPEGTAMTSASPKSASNGSERMPGAPSMKCAGASTCVPVCAPKLSTETFAASPREMAAHDPTSMPGSPSYTGVSPGAIGTLMS